MSKILTLIDGFNFYHRLDEYSNNYENLKWLNYRKLIESYFDKENVSISDIVYFSAIATHRGKESNQRHKIYIKALQRANIEVVLGKFKPKFIKKCPHCFSHPTKNDLKRHEEKNTDVNIAIRLIEAALSKKYDKCFLLSSDNDFSSAIRRAKELNNSMQVIICPPPIGNIKNTKKAILRIKDLEKACECKPLIINWKKIKEAQFDNQFNELENPWAKIDCPTKQIV